MFDTSYNSSSGPVEPWQQNSPKSIPLEAFLLDSINCQLTIRQTKRYSTFPDKLTFTYDILIKLHKRFRWDHILYKDKSGKINPLMFE